MFVCTVPAWAAAATGSTFECTRDLCDDQNINCLVQLRAATVKWYGDKCVALTCPVETNYWDKTVQGYTLQDGKCQPCEIKGAATTYAEGNECYVQSCQNGIPSDDKKSCNPKPAQQTSELTDEEKCKSQDQYLLAQLYATAVKWKDDKCVPTECTQRTGMGRILKNDECVPCDVSNAIQTRVQNNECVAVSCRPGYTAKAGNCVSIVDEYCNPNTFYRSETDYHYATAKYNSNGICIIEKCETGYRLDEKIRNNCVECTENDYSNTKYKDTCIKQETPAAISATGAQTDQESATEQPAIQTTTTETITISGTVTDENGPLPYATVSYGSDNGTKGAVTNDNGYFTLTVPSKDTEVTISYVGYQKQTKKASDFSSNNKITLKADNESIDATIVVDCNSRNNKQLHIKKLEYSKDINKCIPTECEDGYVLIHAKTLAAQCIQNPIGQPCNGDTLRQLSDDQNANTGTIAEYNNDSGEPTFCTIKTCKAGYHPDSMGESCLADCTCGQKQNSTTGTCEPIPQNDKTCSADNATKAEWDCNKNQKSYCKIIECDTANGYDLVDGKCECVVPGFEMQNGKCTIKMVLPKEEYKKEIDDLAKNATAMHEKETSRANKIIGAAGIGITGVGGTMLGAALSETAADTDAERAMRAYLETFRCEYGADKTARGGDVNVQTDLADGLTELRKKYAATAYGLTELKQALGMRPGIETEIPIAIVSGNPVINANTTGLYDDVGTGITGGQYASVSRALANPTGADADAWNAQKEKTKNTLIAGAVTAGVGAVGSAAANIAVNHDNKNQAKDILAKYEKYRKPFNDIGNVRLPLSTCANWNLTGTYPNCNCTGDRGKYYFDTTNGCNECKGDLIVNKEHNDCVCPSDKPYPKADDPTQCLSYDATKCNLTGNIVIFTDGTCKCMDGAKQTNNKCKCANDVQDNQCIPESSAAQDDANKGNAAKNNNSLLGDISFSADGLFDTNESELKQGSEAELEKKIKEFADTYSARADLKTATDYCLFVIGQTDRVPVKKDPQNGNQMLSKARAETVAEILARNDGPFNPKNIKTSGVADKYCPAEKYTEKDNANCRRVDVYWLAEPCNALTSLTSNAQEFQAAQKAVGAMSMILDAVKTDN